MACVGLQWERRRTSSPRIAAASALTATLDPTMSSKHTSGTLLSQTVPNWSASSILLSGLEPSTHPHRTPRLRIAKACCTRLKTAVIGRRYFRGEFVRRVPGAGVWSQ